MIARPEHARWRALVAPAIVLAIVMALTATAVIVTRNAVQDQERQRLAQRRAEVSTFLGSSLSGVESSLDSLAAVVSHADGDLTTRFSATAPDIRSNLAMVAGVLAAEGGRFRVVATVGLGPAVGELVTADRAAIAVRALEADDLVGGVVQRPEGPRTMVAEPAGSDLVVFEDLVIDPTKPITATTDSPYQDVRVSLYASSEPDPDQLVLTTEEEPRVDDSTLLSPFDVGGEEWTLTVAPRGTLTSTIADNAPWMLLGAGALTAVLAAAVTYVVARRRTYALELVAVRTADLRRAQEAADRANRSKSEFLSRMSHELRTPLNAVLGFSQLLEMDNLTEPQRDAVAHIRKSGAHLLELINEVLDISRVESGNMALSPEPVAVADLVTDSVDLVRPLASERGIEVVVARSDAFDAYVLADRQRAKQVLLNLLSNAVKYNRQRGTVAVSCEVPDGGPVRIAVTDTGPGIRPEQVDLLFVPFERLGAEQTEVEGTGIGLALSRNLAEAMGGTLTVETTPGRGSTFTLELPAVEGPVERYDRLGRTPEPEPAVPPQQRERTVLHIEDNLSNLTLVERIIARRPGVRVVAAMQGTLGVELAREHKPQLILLDLHLPDMSGEQVLQRLRDDPATASIPVVIVSADATPGQVQRLLAVGAAGYLTKPIEVPELLRHVDDALERA